MIHKKDVLKIKMGKHFPPQLRLLCYAIAVIGILMILDGSFIFGSIVLVSSIFIIRAPSGIQVDVHNKSYRNYPFIFSRKAGWQSLKIYTDISILSKTISQTMHSARTMGNSISTKDTFHDICLLNKAHRKKLILKRFKNLDDAKKELPVFAEQLALNMAKYNPVISDKTLARKRKDR
jgi:hypothetical protein